MKLNHCDSFVIYRKPYSKEIHIIVGNWTDENNSHNKTGFMFNEFPSSNPIFLVGKKSLVQRSIVVEHSKKEKSPLQFSKEKYITTAKSYIELCRKSDLKKIILSRVISTKNNNANAFELFEKLNSSYHHSFNYLLNHPTKGMWMGASPEELISGNKKERYSTTALAGSKKWSSNVSWSIKEIEEQQYVKTYIEKKLNAHAKKIDCESDLITVRAGNIAHLKSKFLFETSSPILELAKKLHPTPAISGYPTKKSIQLIEENEPHKRSLYCGFLGELFDESVNLFVNLRCMKIDRENLHLFVGGGITDLSIPEDEWEETQIKSETLLSIIKK